MNWTLRFWEDWGPEDWGLYLTKAKAEEALIEMQRLCPHVYFEITEVDCNYDD